MTQQTVKNIRSSYTFYKKNSVNPVDIKTYIKIATGYIKFIVAKVIAGDEVVLPVKMGTFYVTGTKQKIEFVESGVKGVAPNWPKTLALWNSNPECKEKKQLVYNTNEHSDGIRYKFCWSKKRAYVTNKSLYSLRVTREHKRDLSDSIKQGKEY